MNRGVGIKKFLVIALMTTIILLTDVVQAAHSTQENFNHILNTCVSALKDTDDYVDVMKKGDDKVISLRRQDCDSLQETLQFFQHNSTEGAESMSYILTARCVLVARSAKLGYYLDAIKAYRSGNSALVEEYKRRMVKANQEAEQYRIKFLNTYGY